MRPTDEAKRRRLHVELVLRFLAFRHSPYVKGRDVHDYLDNATVEIARDTTFDMGNEGRIFDAVFRLIRGALATDAFRRWDTQNFTGKFLQSVFEVMAHGTALNLHGIEKLSSSRQRAFIRDRAKSLWSNDVFRKYSGPGVRGTDRLAHLLPLAKTFMRP